MQKACAKVLSSSILMGFFWASRPTHDRQNQVACTQATNFVNDPPLLLSFTSASGISGNSCGSCLRRNDTPLGVSVTHLDFGMKGLEPPGSIAIPPMVAQKLCVIVHGFCLKSVWLSGSTCCAIIVRFDQFKCCLDTVP